MHNASFLTLSDTTIKKYRIYWGKTVAPKLKDISYFLKPKILSSKITQGVKILLSMPWTQTTQDLKTKYKDDVLKYNF